MSYLEELLPEFRNEAKIRQPNWNKGEYIYLGENGIVYDERNKPFDFTNEELFADWELYTKPKEEIDWSYIINNKCLCWFWDNKGDEKQIGYLVGINDKRFYLEAPEDCFNSYTYCRPVRRDEVTFYEDKE